VVSRLVLCLDETGNVTQHVACRAIEDMNDAEGRGGIRTTGSGDHLPQVVVTHGQMMRSRM
jgi:hypothetical protein